MQANEDKISSFKDIIKYTKPINEALKENFGDLDAMIEERRKQVEAQRNAMEAARKRAQEEEEKRQKHLDELSLIPTDELDKRYMDAIANNDESTAREMLDESARRNGYGDVDSDYQGQGIEVKNKIGYDHVYVANMARADFYKSSIKDEEQLAQFIKDMVDDADQKDGFIFNRFYADTSFNGVGIPWEEIL